MLSCILFDTLSDGHCYALSRARPHASQFRTLSSYLSRTITHHRGCHHRVSKHTITHSVTSTVTHGDSTAPSHVFLIFCFQVLAFCQFNQRAANTSVVFRYYHAARVRTHARLWWLELIGYKKVRAPSEGHANLVSCSASSIAPCHLSSRLSIHLRQIMIFIVSSYIAFLIHSLNSRHSPPYTVFHTIDSQEFRRLH